MDNYKIQSYKKRSNNNLANEFHIDEMQVNLFDTGKVNFQGVVNLGKKEKIENLINAL